MARQTHDWNQTADTMALLANIHRDVKATAAYSRADFHPLQQEECQIGDADPDTFLDTLIVHLRAA